MGKRLKLSYKERLIHLKLLPTNYWLEFLDLVLVLKRKLGQISINFDNYLHYCNTGTRRAKTGLV